jgi:hypothetical protein
VNVGILNTESYDDNDAPKQWSEDETPIAEIVDKRSVMVNSTFKNNVKKTDQRFLDVTTDVAMTDEPLGVDVGLEDKPTFSITSGNDIQPHGPKAGLKDIDVTTNPRVPNAVDKAVYDTDWNAADAMERLYEDVDEHHITKLLSSGNLGTKDKRKLVPTRWSITAVDSNVSSNKLDAIREFPEYDYVAHTGGHYGNRFIVLFFPKPWSYELIETYIGGKQRVLDGKTRSASDHEDFHGRSDYVEETAGAYYATRLAVAEYLEERQRQASCLVLRFITDDYYVPLGVWVVREGVRKALRSQSITFGSEELMLEYAKKLTFKKCYGFDVDPLFNDSALLTDIHHQHDLGDYV